MSVRRRRFGLSLCFGLALAVPGCGPTEGAPGEASSSRPPAAEGGERDTSSSTHPHPADLAVTVADHYGPDELRTHALGIVEHERPSGSEGENAAIDYIVSTLTDSGVPVEVHEFSAYLSTPVSASLQVVGSDFAPPAITMAYSASAEALVGEVVDLGGLADLPQLEVGTGEAIDVIGVTLSSAAHPRGNLPDVQGKIVLVTGQARNEPTAVLQALGAAAVVFVNPEERLNDLIVTSTWGSPSLRNYHRLPTLPVAHIARSAGDRLRALLAAGVVRVQLDVEVDTGWRPLRLAVARIDPASRSDAPYVLFGGHIDAWYHGGTDEGASNAAMVALAQAFHAERAALTRGLVVAWWPGHSNGRYAGSTWFADRFAAELQGRALAYVNVDGIGQMGASRLGAATTASLAELARGAILDAVGVPIEPARPATNSDQSFNGVGLPLLQLHHTRSEEDRGTWWWHTPQDTFDKIDYDVLKADTDLYASALAALTASAVFPVDLVAQAEVAGVALVDRAAQSDGQLDLAAARAAHARMARAFAVLQVDAAREPTGAVPDLDLALVRVLRPLHRALYVAGAPHHPDGGRNPGALPGLWPASILQEESRDSDRFGFALTTLLREGNRIVELFSESADRAEQLSQRIKGDRNDD